MSRRECLAWLALLGGCMFQPARAEPADAPSRRVDAAMVARLPYPGTTSPTAVAFTPDGTALTYLLPESADSLSRVLWRAEVGGGAPHVVARPPGGGDTDANVSAEEALRRERQRLRDTGITHVARASRADAAVLPIGGDLYLIRAAGPLIRLTENDAPEIDPRPDADARRVAFVRDGELFVLDVKSKREVQLTRGGADGLTHGLAEFMAQEEMGRQTGYWWSPDGERIAYQETDERHIAPFVIAHQGGPEYTTETHRYPFAGKPNAKVRLGVVPADGGETRWLPVIGDGEDAYLARVDWDGPSSLLVQVLSRDQKSLKLFRVDVDSGSKSLLIEEKADTWVNLHDDLRVVEGSGEILWSSERTGFRHLELRDREGKLIRTLTEGDWPVDGVVRLDRQRREVWFAAGLESPLGSHLYRVSLDGGEVERITREPGTHRATVAADGTHFVDTFSDLETPPRTTLCDRDGKVLATLHDAADDPRLEMVVLTPPRLTEFKDRDGVTLFGAYYAPERVDATEKAPLVVMVYGGPHVQRVTRSWEMTADLQAQFLNDRGFAVWKCDNRGSSRRGHAFEAALNRRMGEVEVRDQVEGVKFAAASFPEIDAGRVGITGGSYGGYMTLRSLLLAPEVFKAGVAVAPVTDWDGYDTTYTERYMGTPDDNSGGYQASSVLPRAGELRGDLLLIHGLLDENVHFRHSARLTSALIAAGRPFEFLPLPEERHSSRKVPGRTYVTERTAEFFERTLGREGGPAK